MKPAPNRPWTNAARLSVLGAVLALASLARAQNESPLQMVRAVISAGNGNGAIDSNECNLLHVVLADRSGTGSSNLSAILSTTNSAILINQPLSVYSVIPAGGTGTNLIPFQFTTLSRLACGTNINMVLSVITSNQDSFTVPFVLSSGSAGSALRFDNHSSIALPDISTLTSTVMVAGVTSPLVRLSVSLHIAHPAVEELHITLIGPDGTTVNLSDDNGGQAANYGNDCSDDGRTIFADAALTSIASGPAPFLGPFSPEEPLAGFNGKFGPQVNGAWRLVIQDDAEGNTGALHCWSLFISPAVCSDGGGPCVQCRPPIVGAISAADPLQTGRLTRDSSPSHCFTNKFCPGLSEPSPGQVHYDAYTFTNNGPANCVTMSLGASCGGIGLVFGAAYLTTFNPANPCANYLGDIGFSPNSEPKSCSFLAPAAAVFVVVVHEVNNTGGCTNYVLNVTGFECAPRLAVERTTGSSLVVKWPSSAVGYQLEQAASFLSPLPIWSPVSNQPVVINSQFQVTNVISGASRFYRLRKP